MTLPMSRFTRWAVIPARVGPRGGLHPAYIETTRDGWPRGITLFAVSDSEPEKSDYVGRSTALAHHIADLHNASLATRAVSADSTAGLDVEREVFVASHQCSGSPLHFGGCGCLCHAALSPSTPTPEDPA